MKNFITDLLIDVVMFGEARGGEVRFLVQDQLLALEKQLALNSKSALPSRDARRTARYTSLAFRMVVSGGELMWMLGSLMIVGFATEQKNDLMKVCEFYFARMICTLLDLSEFAAFF